MKYEKGHRVEKEGEDREGVIMESPYLSKARENRPEIFHDLRAVQWDDTDTIGWINRDLLAIKDED